VWPGLGLPAPAVRRWRWTRRQPVASTRAGEYNLCAVCWFTCHGHQWKQIVGRVKDSRMVRGNWGGTRAPAGGWQAGSAKTVTNQWRPDGQ
jgi:hypothetical protein